MDPEAEWTLPATGANKSRVLYVHRTEGLEVEGQHVAQPTGIQLHPELPARLVNGPHSSELLLLEGVPIGEPVAQHGPFVMNTRQELQDAFRDYQRDQFGGWPWPENDPVLDRETGRFAKHADGRIERPSTSQTKP